MTAPPPPRRGFKSMSSEPGPNAARSRPWGFVTKHQVSGWRFLIRRISNGVALRDTRMLADPLRRQGRALTGGALLGVMVVAGAFVLAMLRPAGTGGNHAILTERSTGALYVRVNDELHPVLNLASARLIVGKPDDPTPVKAKELDRLPLGNLLGIPGAPARISQNPARDARWTVCDTTRGGGTETIVISGDLAAGTGHAEPFDDTTAILASLDAGTTTWLIWGGKRSRIDLNDAAVAAAVGINLDTPATRPINRSLLNLIPESPPLAVPFIANAGDPPRFGWPGPGRTAPVIGSVVTDHDEHNVGRYYVVTGDGLQPISPVIAAILRSTNAYGLVDPPVLTPDQVAKTPKTDAVAVDNYPAHPLKVLDPKVDPVTCGQWTKLHGAPTSKLTLLAGQSLPIPAAATPVSVIATGTGTTDKALLPTGTGYFVQVTGQQPTSATKESVFWVSDLGVRYGVEATDKQPTSPAEALGMTAEPLPIPWSVLSLFAAGPTLSKDDALIAH